MAPRSDVEANAQASEGPPPDLVYVFGRDTAALSGARRSLAGLLGSAELAQDVMLVASELVTNAVVHTDDGGELRAWDADPLRLEVDDSSSVLPSVAHGRDVGGRGLAIVDELSSQWGAALTGAGKVVWAEFDRRDH